MTKKFSPSTNKDLCRCIRLLYRISSERAIWQREMNKLLKGIEGVTVFLNDTKLTASNNKFHFQGLNEVLNRLVNANIRITWKSQNF